MIMIKTDMQSRYHLSELDFFINDELNDEVLSNDVTVRYKNIT